MNMTSPTLIYITAANREEAILLSRELLNMKIVACANIIDHATSLYWWDGEIEQNNENIVILKTMSTHTEKVISVVRSLHSYSCPAIVAVPINDGNPEYINWIQEQISPI